MEAQFIHIDFDHLKRYVGEDPDLTAEIFGLFKNQVDMWSSRLDPELNDEVWGMMAHSLKGTAKAIGAVTLADICEQAEQQVGETRRPGAREVAIEKIENLIDLIMIEIQRWEYRQTILKMKSV